MHDDKNAYAFYEFKDGMFILRFAVDGKAYAFRVPELDLPKLELIRTETIKELTL